MQEEDILYMQQALLEAETAKEMGEIPVGAVVVCEGKIVAKGHNLTETLNDVTAHAEMQTITSAADYLGGKYLNNCTLYVTLEPCMMCAGALNWAQIKRVVYGADDKKKGFSKFGKNVLHAKTEITSGILADKCSLLLTDFFKEKRK